MTSYLSSFGLLIMIILRSILVVANGIISLSLWPTRFKNRKEAIGPVVDEKVVAAVEKGIMDRVEDGGSHVRNVVTLHSSCRNEFLCLH